MFNNVLTFVGFQHKGSPIITFVGFREYEQNYFMLLLFFTGKLSTNSLSIKILWDDKVPFDLGLVAKNSYNASTIKFQ